MTYPFVADPRNLPACEDRMEADLVPRLLDFLREENIKMKLRRTSDSEFWIESPDESIAAKFVINKDAHEVLFDVFSPKIDRHLNLETLKNVEKIELIAEEKKKWKIEKAAEEVRLVLDAIGPWARRNKYRLKEKEMI
jgi:hypothetical protein